MGLLRLLERRSGDLSFFLSSFRVLVAMSCLDIDTFCMSIWVLLHDLMR